MRLFDGHSSCNKNVATNCTYLPLSVRSTCVLVSSPTQSGTIRCEVCHRSTPRTKCVGTNAGEGVRYKRSMEIDSKLKKWRQKTYGANPSSCKWVPGPYVQGGGASPQLRIEEAKKRSTEDLTRLGPLARRIVVVALVVL